MIHPQLDRQAPHEDFLTHLQERLGLSSNAAAVATLANWMSSYQPGPTARALATRVLPTQKEAA